MGMILSCLRSNPRRGAPERRCNVVSELRAGQELGSSTTILTGDECIDFSKGKGVYSAVYSNRSGHSNWTKNMCSRFRSRRRDLDFSTGKAVRGTGESRKSAPAFDKKKPVKRVRLQGRKSKALKRLRGWTNRAKGENQNIRATGTKDSETRADRDLLQQGEQIQGRTKNNLIW